MGWGNSAYGQAAWAGGYASLPIEATLEVVGRGLRVGMVVEVIRHDDPTRTVLTAFPVTAVRFREEGVVVQRGAEQVATVAVDSLGLQVDVMYDLQIRDPDTAAVATLVYNGVDRGLLFLVPE